MRTLTQFALLVALLTTATSARAADTAKDVENAITALNEAFKVGDATAIKAMETDDHLSVTSWGGTQTREESIKTLPDLKLSEYKPVKIKITVLGPDAALVTYPLEIKGTYKGKDVPAKSFASAVWVRKGEKWLEHYYQETPLEK